MKTLLALLILCVSLVSAQSVQKSLDRDVLVPNELGKPIFLQLNDVYVAYVYPSNPYLTGNNVPMIPIKALGWFLGLNVLVSPDDNYRKSSGPVFTVFNHTGYPEVGRQIKFFSDFEEAFVDIQSGLNDMSLGPAYSIKLPTMPKYLEDEDEMFVPFFALAEVFDLRSHWEPELRLLQVDVPFDRLVQFYPWDITIAAESTRAFVPEDISFFKQPEPDGNGEAVWQLNLKIQGFPSINDGEGPLMMTFDGTFSSNDGYSVPSIQTGYESYRCPIKEGTCTWQLRYNETSLMDLKYVTFRLARVLNSKELKLFK